MSAPISDLKRGIDKEWRKMLFSRDAPINKLLVILQNIYKFDDGTIYFRDILAPFRECPYDLYKVLIIGNKPYGGNFVNDKCEKIPVSTGLCYSSRVMSADPKQMELYNALENQKLLTRPPHNNDFLQWAKQGVLMINFYPTHHCKLWEQWSLWLIGKLMSLPQTKLCIADESLRDILGESPNYGWDSLTSMGKLINIEVSHRRVVYTDGAFKTSSKKCAWAFYDADMAVHKAGKITAGKVSAPVAEYTAMAKAMEYLVESNDHLTKYVVICTDHKNLERAFNLWIHKWLQKDPELNTKGDGNPISNVELVKRIYAAKQKLSKRGFTIEIIHYNSHQKEPIDKQSYDWELWNGNRLVDHYASLAC
jgi:ribonuclease HI